MGSIHAERSSWQIEWESTHPQKWKETQSLGDGYRDIFRHGTGNLWKLGFCDGWQSASFFFFFRMYLFILKRKKKGLQA